MEIRRSTKLRLVAMNFEVIAVIPTNWSLSFSGRILEKKLGHCLFRQKIDIFGCGQRMGDLQFGNDI